MSFNIRSRRLQNEYQKVRELVDRSDLIHIVATDGNPPDRYRIRFTAKGVESVRNNLPVFRESHEVSIYLHAEYPLKQPQLKWLTPIFHPNIHVTGAVCIGAWWAAKTLDELLLTLGEMIQYRNLDPTDPMNSKAAQWAQRNRHIFPVDDRDLKGGSLSDLIQIGEEEDASDFEINFFD